MKKALIAILITMSLLATIVVFYLFSGKKMNNVADNNQIGNYHISAIDEDLLIENNIVVKSVRPVDSSDYLAGDLNAPVQIIIYSDFDCPFSAEFYDTTKDIVTEFGDKAVIAFRHFPMSSHAQAMPAAVASECAAEQGMFWRMYSEMFEAKKSNRLSIDVYLESAKKIGLDMAAFNQCLQNENTKDRIKAQMVEGKNFGIIGTPTVFVNGVRYPGAYPMDDFINDQGEEEKGVRNIIKQVAGNG